MKISGSVLRSLLFVTVLRVLSEAHAGEPASSDTPSSQAISDNSFLIEEAYNQEPGTVQTIQSFQFMKAKNWSYLFTQEFPLCSKLHQISYSVPVMHLPRTFVRDPKTGIGDVLVNYRYQALDRAEMAIAPRFSVVLPTGSEGDELGGQGVGFQTNIPVSLELSKRWVSHWNLGATWTAVSEDLVFNYGASLIYLWKDDLNFLLEAVGTQGPSGKDTFYLNPGVRFAANFKNTAQIVPGIALPIGLGPSARDYGIFLYFSYESKWW